MTKLDDIPHQQKDAYTTYPLLWFAALSVPALWAIIFDQGGIIPGGKIFGALLMIIMLMIAWLIVIFIAILRRLWRRTFSIAIAGIIVLIAGIIGLKYRDEVRFQLVRPIYLMQIYSAFNTNGPNKMQWEWVGMSGVHMVLVYDASDEDGTPEGIDALTSKAKKMSSLCRVEVQKMGSHFFLETTNCQS